ncbi:uncharacterized protein CDAR_530031 [Caerostris darwini]|uniref:Uncharacterized protein n=1 Tax=Caerostris darwini TaxID=1538125 RepID=A0AAV4RY07_9ARAC|nr:uncharacterized protein CDAR_530031 [Caerostris darwini]
MKNKVRSDQYNKRKVLHCNKRSQSMSQKFGINGNTDVVYYTADPRCINSEGLDHFLNYQFSVTKAKSRNYKFRFLKDGWLKTVLRVGGFLCILIGFLYQSCSFLKLYLKFPTTMELNVANEAVIDFPAITVCNSNPVRYQEWCKKNPFVCIRKPNETLEDIRKRLEYLYDKLSRERRIQLGIRFEDFVIHAEYEEEIIKEKFDWYYDYEFTNCYTFNAIWGDHNRPLRKAFLFNPVTGTSSELTLCVNIDVNNYSNLTGSVVGRVMMTIHANDIVPNPTYDAASLEAGKFYSYGIQKVTTELLERPYQTKCRNYEKEKEVRTGAKMSQKNCLLECFKAETQKTCGCTYRRLSLMYGGTPCEHDSQYHCLTVIDDQVFSTCNPQCPMACRKIEFKYVATDSEPLREESAIYEKMQIDKIFQSREEMKNMACLRIHYGSTETRTMAYKPKYAFIELFSLLGGYSGLWLGFSLFKCYEFLLTKFTELKSRKKVAPGKVKKIKKKKY